MALDIERKSLGVKHLLRKLRGSSPHPVSPEDTLEGLFHPETEEEEDLGDKAPRPRGGPAAPGGAGGGAPLQRSSGRNALLAR